MTEQVIDKGWVLAAGVLALSMGMVAGCGGVEGGDHDTECSDCLDWAIDESQAALPTCSAQPLVLGQMDVPEIPAWVEAGQCEEVTADYHGTYRDESTRWGYEDGRLVRERRRDGELIDTTEFELSDDGQVQQVSRRDEMFNSYVYQPDGLGHRDDRWELDEQGRLVAYEMDWVDERNGEEELVQTVRVEHSYGAHGLTGRSERRWQPHHESSTEFVWDYDEEGRLVASVRYRDGTERDRVVWDYSGAHLVGLKRAVNGQTIERYRWDFDGNDRLVSRSIEQAMHGLDQSGEAVDYLPEPQAFDTHTKQLDQVPVVYPSGDTFQSELADNRWAGANGHRQQSDGGCRPPAMAVGHGYPISDGVYHLGFEDDQAVSPQMAQQYSERYYSVYGMGPGEWYGHLGVATAWPAAHHGAVSQMAITVDYDRQERMVAEHLSYQTWEREAEAVDVVRSREFDGQKLVQDQILVTAGEEEGTATLRFDYDGQGRLVQRQRLLQDELASVARWDYEGDRAVELTIEGARGEGQSDEQVYGGAGALGPHWVVGRHGEGPELSARARRDYDSEGRLRLQTLNPVEQSTQQRRLEQEFGEFGLVRRLKQVGASTMDQRFEYDRQGQLIEERTDQGDTGQWDRRQTYQYDDAGRLVESVIHWANGNEQVEARHYQCGN